ncbi:MAG: methionyl-tRNA formyltransferase [Gallionella sp.]|nr:methionyl-tRNA formyltransferase [Gallionella sp.]
MKIIFAGTPHFAASALQALLGKHQIAAVLTQPDRPAGRGMQLSQSPVKQLALQHELPVLQPLSLKNEAIQQTLGALNADVMVVAAYGLILPGAVLAMPRYGCLNIHASLLPRWRGAAPIQRAILAGDKETGITIMQMDEGLDTGAMLLRRACPISGEDTATTLHDTLAALGASCLLEALELLEQGKLIPQAQDDAMACYAAKLQKSEAGIDWTRPAEEIHRAIRAFNPFPGSVTNLANVPGIKIWRSSLQSKHSGLPGGVLQVGKSGILVACGIGALNLETLQKPGGKPQPVQQFLQSVPVAVGDQFT